MTLRILALVELARSSPSRLRNSLSQVSTACPYLNQKPTGIFAVLSHRAQCNFCSSKVVVTALGLATR